MRWNSYALRLCVITFVGLFVQPSNVTAAVINVNCPVDNLSAAINAAVPGDTIIITGNCAENIFIGIDFLTLTGNMATDGVDVTAPLRFGTPNRRSLCLRIWGSKSKWCRDGKL